MSLVQERSTRSGGTGRCEGCQASGSVDRNGEWWWAVGCFWIVGVIRKAGYVPACVLPRPIRVLRQLTSGVCRIQIQASNNLTIGPNTDMVCYFSDI